MCKENKLLEEIENLRMRVVKLTIQKSFSYPEVLKISQNLDSLLNRYDKSVMKKI
ncbi:aspartyl-phosphate phosphatase Spo0E family protein [Bacillus sp. AL-1R]